jgi:hypothetical protein
MFRRSPSAPSVLRVNLDSSSCRMIKRGHSENWDHKCGTMGSGKPHGRLGDAIVAPPLRNGVAKAAFSFATAHRYGTSSIIDRPSWTL